MDSSKRSVALSVLLTLVTAGAVVEAAPLATGPALSGDGDGINSF